MDELAHAIATTKVPVYARAGGLVEPIYRDIEAADMEGHKRTTRTVYFKRLTVQGLRYIVDKHVAKVVQWDGRMRQLVGVPAPTEMLEQLLSLDHGPIPPIAGVIAAWGMRPERTHHLGTGL